MVYDCSIADRTRVRAGLTVASQPIEPEATSPASSATTDETPPGALVSLGNAVPGRWQDRMGLATVTAYFIIAATAWYLLKEFAPLLRPLLLAVFFCYMILPIHHRLARRLPTVASLVFLAGICVALLVGVGLVVVGSVTELSSDMPQLVDRAKRIIDDVSKYAVETLPPWLADAVHEMRSGQVEWKSMAEQAVTAFGSAVAGGLSDAVLVGIYLIFLLLEAGRIPERIRVAFANDQPDRILGVVGNINEAMASYLRVKAKASLVLAIPAGIVLWTFGVKFTPMWTLLTFLLNFIPYLGSIISAGSPILLAYLQMDSLGRPTMMAVLLVSIHLLSAYVVEPAMTGKAIDLSPIVILLSLAFWGLCWGLTGMLLAVPLTVMLRIVLEHLKLTRPFARLMAEE
jgi:AI-2 transport protein TqsA